MWGSFSEELLEQFKHDYAERADKAKMPCNKPKTTGPSEKSSHVVKACGSGLPEGGKVLRFGSKGVKGSPPKEGESEKYKARREAWYARHRKNIDKGPSSSAYWAARTKW